MNSHRYNAREIDAVYRVIAERRDMRHFRPDPVEPAMLQRILAAAHRAPSVGYMQPWRFVRVVNARLRSAIRDDVEAERRRTADAMGERRNEFMKLKVEGLDQCAELLVVALTDGRARHVFGRRTMPEMDLASAACAIQNLWLAARAEGLGMGWVSLFEPEVLARRLAMPEGAAPIAILCLGHVDRFYDRPMLAEQGWADRLPLTELIGIDGWPDADSGGSGSS